eukprot:12911286-Alexandrium_andersonii.AAC.1
MPFECAPGHRHAHMRMHTHAHTHAHLVIAHRPDAPALVVCHWNAMIVPDWSKRLPHVTLLVQC